MAGKVAARPGEVAEELQVDAADEVDRPVLGQQTGGELLGDLVGGDDPRGDSEGELPIAA